MKASHLLPLTALAAILATGCDSPDGNAAASAARIAELERTANEAIERQRQLEQEIQDREIAAERDAIERERLQIEEARLQLEQQQAADAEAQAEQIRIREIELANREGRIEALQLTLAEKQSDLQQRDNDLSERDRQLAGREAIALNEPEPEVESAPVGDYGMFYDSLSSYGSWFDSPDYGYVWQPVIVRDVSWRPYTRGRWACSDHGWTWISDEPFGWATYHYGRWALCRGNGWIWVPGSQWAPSWVSWRSSGSHIGWAPLPPETLAYGDHRWDSTVDVTFGIGASWFSFVEVRHFGNSIQNHCLPFHQNPVFIQQTINITNIHFHNRRVISGGPTYGDVSRQVDRKLPFYRLEIDRRGSHRDSLAMRPRAEGDRLRVQAPNFAAAWNDGIKPKQVRGRIEEVRIDREQALRPEITERFRQSRQEGRDRSKQAIADLGGEEKFHVRRAEELARNRKAAEPSKRPDLSSRKPAAPAETKGPPAEEPRPNRPDRPAPIEEKPSIARREQERPAAAAPRETRPAPAQPGNPARPAITPNPARNRDQDSRVASRPAASPAPPNRNIVQETRNPRPTPADRANTPTDPTRQAAENEQASRLRRQQEEQAENTRQQQQQEARREQVRQQQAEAQRQQARQQELARQQQAEQARREQARQQQMEQARQQQAEQSRREQARQQQMEQARQQQMEQARREQAEQSRREQARQQQEEQSRREQSRQQEQQRVRETQRVEEERGRNRGR